MSMLICYKRTGSANSGAIGDDFSDNLTEVKRLKKVELYGNRECVTKIISTYVKTDGQVESQEHGNGGYLQGTLELDENEHIIYCGIRYGKIINLLHLETNKKKYAAAGGVGGDEKWENSIEEQKVDAFYGFYGKTYKSNGECCLSSFGLFGSLYKSK